MFVVCSFMVIGEMLCGSPLLALLPSASGPFPFFSDELPWWEGGGGDVVAESLSNKGSSGLLWILRCAVLICSPAGRGGEGRGWGDAQHAGSGVGTGVWPRECLSCSSRSARWWLMLVLWRSEPESFDSILSASSIKLVGGCLPCSADAVFPPLAGRGGMVRKEVSVSAAVGGCHCSEVPGSAAATDSKRRRRVAGATLGQEADPVALERLCSSFFVLSVRIFSSLGVAPSSRAAPSGVVPGCSGGGSSVLRLFFIGGSRGPDRVSAVTFWVLSVNPRDLVVICFSSESLYVNVHPPPI